MPFIASTTIARVSSVEPVSWIAQPSINGRTESRQRRITGASSLTIIDRQMVWPWAFIGVDPVVAGSSCEADLI